MKSMTGFASGKGEGHGVSWEWDIRAVNARGLDIRLRVPDWIEQLEQTLRPIIQKKLGRGSVSLSLKVTRDSTDMADTMDQKALSRALANIKIAEESALVDHDLELAPSSAVEIMKLPGLISENRALLDTEKLRHTLAKDLSSLLIEFDDMRKSEGLALKAVIADQLSKIASLTQTATSQAEARGDAIARQLRENLALVMENVSGADEDRVAQELAILAVKADVREEIDRLKSHVEAALGMLEADAPVGRKLDFLTQEFNREANTLCSKAQSKDLSTTGLELKAVIEQMREQVQNVE